MKTLKSLLPRNNKDYRTLLWVLVPPVLIAAQYARPRIDSLSLWVQRLLGACLRDVAHNHNHCHLCP